MVVLDASILLLLLDPDARPPVDPATAQPVARAKDRIDHLIAMLDGQREKIVIPTPVLSEVLVRAGDAGPAYLEELGRSARFRIAPFDIRAAVELADLTRNALDDGDKRGGSTAPWQKIKIDRQIIAIARTENVTTIFSDDDDVRRLAQPLGIQVVGTAELPLPPEDSQQRLDFDAPGSS
jgi:predicted nucleic acid-binding protein